MTLDDLRDLARHPNVAAFLRVIREALVNAMMHRSYRSHGPVQIIRYANRLEIRNPGFSLKSPEHLGEPGSQPRNPRIAAVLHETRFAETKGNRLKIGDVLLEITGETDPCFRMDEQQEGLQEALRPHWRGGVTCRVLSEGQIAVGDEIIMIKTTG